MRKFFKKLSESFKRAAWLRKSGVKVDSNGGFSLSSEDLFKDKEKTIKTMNKMNAWFEKNRNHPFD